MRDLDWLIATAPREVTVLSGAGTSVEGPSSLPTGYELTERVFTAYFPSGTLATVLTAHEELGWLATPPCPDSPPGTDLRLPRLETVLGVVARVHGEQAVDDSVADVAHAAPNRLHRFLAHHLARGGGHLTANFDECVEKAGAALGHPPNPDGVLHFHGATGPRGGVLGVTLARIEKGFPPDLATRFLDALRARPAVLVLGYSGSDFFDVDVVVVSLPAGALAGTRVLWLLYSGHPPHFVTSDEALPPLVRALRRAGARVDVLCGPTEVVLDVLGRGWGFPLLGHAVPRDPSPPTFTVDDSLREVAALELFLEIGLFKEVRALLSPPPPNAPRTLLRAATSALLWEQGRWNDLRGFWRRVRPVTDAERVRRVERIGATWWVQGRLLPAYLWLTHHRRRVAAALGDEHALLLAETEGRVLEHMLRTPDLAWFARTRARNLLTVLEEPGQTAGVHPFRTRSDLRNSLAHAVTGSARDGHATVSTEWFSQASSLLAWVTYRHRELRDSYDPGSPDTVLSTRYRALRAQYETIGSRSGALRTILLPGAERVFTTCEVLRDLWKLQHGPWHRIRILARHVHARRSR
ncbi:hypothetical protein ABZ816_39970 [Actinosynnema sp. NPDC047251]|uniref:SIR2-like domain-containing protein n=1 Tax=Saccharothrix espanaensis (strain ATCC 51144 / DSM 44229 / JCM 9112 / NBRC 15066 / NRRL 15764) TaxID=1179773 RepID=K0JV54_SACES|nr:hypothetical protein [Saccharothrix espanaensis]CCH29392.1 hypothetical protein BN6_20710 [Saccharothrix espanaensis DSM 44229]